MFNPTEYHYHITREYHFSAAHRLEGHPKCGRLHGHNYKLEVTLSAKNVSITSGWIMDFGDLDKFVKPVIAALDHRYLYSNANLEANDPYVAAGDPDDMFFLDVSQTTAELMAWWIYEALRPHLSGYFKMEVTLWETPKSKATFKP